LLSRTKFSDASTVFPVVESYFQFPELCKMRYISVVRTARAICRRPDFAGSDYIFHSPASFFSGLFRRLRRKGITGAARATLELFAEESLIRTIRGHRDVMGLLNRPSTKELNKRFGTSSKYLRPYLGRRFGRKARRDILLHHYRFLAACAPEDFHHKILDHSHILWQQTGEQNLAIGLCPNPRYEGELSLVFYAADIPIFELSFTIGPGSSVGSSEADIMLIGRVQGGRRNDLIRVAARICRHISPKYLLAAAAQSLAMALGIRSIAAVGNEEQVSDSDDPFYLSDYDVFWESLLAAKAPSNFYQSALPFPQKPLSEVPTSHRRNTKLKRQFKESVGLAVAHAFTTGLLNRDFVVPAMAEKAD
jgi:uncharacterized protein